MQAWIWLALAGLAEIAWVVGLKYSGGLSKLWPSVFTIVALALSMWLLGLATRTLPIGTSYAIWTGMGAVGAALAGVALFGEPATLARFLCIGLIVAGVVGLKLVTPA